MGRSVPQFSGLGNTNREASAPLQAAPQNGESLIRTSTHLLGMKLGYHRAEHEKVKDKLQNIQKIF